MLEKEKSKIKLKHPSGKNFNSNVILTHLMEETHVLLQFGY